MEAKISWVSMAPSELSEKPIMTNTNTVKIIVGTVVNIIYRMWVNKSVPAIAAARFVVSLNGESLSPKYAPLNMAPAVIPKEMSKALAIPISAIPTVAEVVQLLPVAMEITAQITTQDAKKIVGFKTCNP